MNPTNEFKTYKSWDPSEKMWQFEVIHKTASLNNTNLGKLEIEIPTRVPTKRNVPEKYNLNINEIEFASKIQPWNNSTKS